MRRVLGIEHEDAAFLVMTCRSCRQPIDGSDTDRRVFGRNPRRCDRSH